MEPRFKELQAWLEAASQYELPSFNELPSVPLYMEQVTDYINKILLPINPAQKDLLTSFMVNNYVKAKIIKEPEKKKYTEEQLGYLLAITTLKRTLSMSEISLLIELDKDVSNDKSVLYGFFRVMAKDIFQETAKKIKSKSDLYLATYEKQQAEGNPKAEQNLRDSFALSALRLAIQGGVDQAIAQSILEELIMDLHGQKAYKIESTPGHKEMEREEKISRAQSRRIAAAKVLSEKEETIAKKANDKKQDKKKEDN